MNSRSQDCDVKPSVHSPEESLSPAPGIADAKSIAAILEVLRGGERFLVCSHTRLDGDAVGSMLAMGMVLQQMGKRVDLVTPDRIPVYFQRLPGAGAVRTLKRVTGPYHAAIVLESDSVARTRLRGLEAFFLINIDHHATGRLFANLNWIDSEAPSAGQMVYRLAQAAGVVITPQIAQCIYTTLLTDTGGFCYGPLRASTFALAHDLVAAGADPIGIAQDVYFSAPASRLLLLGAALRNLKREGRLAWLWVTDRDVARSCATEEDCEGIVNIALGIADIEAAFFLRQLPEGLVRASLRSKRQVNVASIAARLGGGGHVTAAGCTLQGPLPRAIKEILAPMRAAVAGLNGKPAFPGRNSRALEKPSKSVSLVPVETPRTR